MASPSSRPLLYMTSTGRSLLFVAAILVISVFVGGRYGPSIGSAATAHKQDAVETEVAEMAEAIAILEREYAEDGDFESALYNGAIPAMLQRLDPHSMFFEPKAFERLREDQRGSYAGVGMLIKQYGEETIVDYPFPKTPAFRAGIRPGDVIASIDGESARELTVDQVALNVRGLEGTTVRVGVRREGVEDLIEVSLVRASIPRASVPLAFYIDPGVAYVRIDSFNETTADEIDKILGEFEKQDLRGLLLDLRDNQGGLLSAGVHVTERFLDRGQSIVSHHGRASQERAYEAKRRGARAQYPMVVLANCHSASASEIVAGALQDHDRALVVGSNTFGKGLVQAVYNLSGTAGLVLTTARYYTPSGRLIQRPYDGVVPASYFDDPCSDSYRPPKLDPRLTDLGRQVYGGGGIAPDVELPELRRTEFQRGFQMRRAFEGYAQRYCLAEEDLRSGWQPGRADFDAFEAYLTERTIPYTRQELAAEASWVNRELKKHIYIACFDIDKGLRAEAELDPAVRQAVDLLPEAAQLLDRVTESLAQKR